MFSTQVSRISHPPSFATISIYPYCVEAPISDFIYTSPKACIEKLVNLVLSNLRLIQHSPVFPRSPISPQPSLCTTFRIRTGIRCSHIILSYQGHPSTSNFRFSLPLITTPHNLHPNCDLEQIGRPTIPSTHSTPPIESPPACHFQDSVRN
jgi:hypothetical protein